MAKLSEGLLGLVIVDRVAEFYNRCQEPIWDYEVVDATMEWLRCGEEEGFVRFSEEEIEQVIEELIQDGRLARVCGNLTLSISEKKRRRLP